ncbi:potassium channel family protein [Rubellimicrobium roseum]|uniref:potassium channel family protein n=1 Tax=Rubellimicrobium roseum TaxID=687525 RepID=UPI001C3F4911|nr:potassium channel family protein [Rubellimicrobium roseum]
MALWRSVLDLVHGLGSAVRDPAIRVLLSLTMTVVLLATAFYHLVEGWRLLDAAYFSVVTMATVGFGDLVPRTDLGKVFTVFLILFGIGLFVASASTFAEHVVRRATGPGRPRTRSLRPPAPTPRHRPPRPARSRAGDRPGPARPDMGVAGASTLAA